MITVKKQLFDLSYLNQIDDKGLIAEVINMYLEDTQIDFLKMNIALQKSDYENIRTTLDKMKVSTSMVQANQLYKVLEEIEIIAKYGGKYSELCRLGNFARYEFDQLKYQLELYLKHINTVLKDEKRMRFQSPNHKYPACL